MSAQDQGRAPIITGRTVLVGMGERTSHHAITQLARALSDQGAAERVVIAGLPHSRAAMHLDTVFTFCDAETVTAFGPVVDHIVPLVVRPSSSHPSGLEIERQILNRETAGG